MDGCNTLAITHNPEATCLTVDFVRNQRVFVLFKEFKGTKIGALAPIVPQRG